MVLPPDVSFVMCDICDTPFNTGQFNIIVSNQVIEHIADLPAAFAEIRRVSADDALLVFSVPTSIWRLLSVPGQVCAKVKNLSRRLRAVFCREEMLEPGSAGHEAEMSIGHGLLWKIGIHGHGCYPGFFECLRVFRVKRWRRLFESNGFRVVSEGPLLCYGSSHWPIIPTNRILARWGIASSYFFAMRCALTTEGAKRSNEYT